MFRACYCHHQEVFTVYVQQLVRVILKIKLFKIT
jgi:hypothetical protein